MRPFTSTLPLHEAMRILLEAARPIERTERVRLDAADGRVVAHDVVSTVDVPPFDRAAMDGYAVVAAETAGATRHAPVALTCVDRLFTGQVPERPLRPGECIEIATGAPMPEGADAVVMVEESDRTADAVRIFAPVTSRQNIGRRAADIATGRVVVASGDTMTPSRTGALAAVGVDAVDVFARPIVAMLSTGNEITEPGRPLPPGHVYDINRFTIDAVVRRHGGVGHPLPPAGDTLDALDRALDVALGSAQADIVVFSGGSSVGDRDLMVDCIERRGVVLFHGIAVKPGKPTLFGRVGATPVFGMPGYPTSCLSNAYMLLAPFLRKVARLAPWRPHSLDLPLSRRIGSVPGRHQFYTVRIVDGRAEPAFKASGDITSMAHADGYIEIAADVDAVEAGTVVRVKLF